MTPDAAGLSRQGARRLFDYTEWANRLVREAAAELPLEEWSRDLKSSHGGVGGTLVHTLGAEWIWLERWNGRSPPGMPRMEELAEPGALERRWRALEQERAAWLEGLDEGGLAAVCRYRSMAGQPFESPLWQLVQHVANHSTYHRGQVVAMLRMLGARVPGTDLVAWDRQA